MAAKPPTAVDQHELSFRPPLYSQRAELVRRLLEEYHCCRIVDAGCSVGDLTKLLLMSSLTHTQIQYLAAIDLNRSSLQAMLLNAREVSSAFVGHTTDAEVQLIWGDLTTSFAPFSTSSPLCRIGEGVTARDRAPSDMSSNTLLTASLSSPSFSSPSPALSVDQLASADGNAAVDAVISIEVLEHIPPHQIAAFTFTVFVDLGARRGAQIVVLTTPNRSENYRMEHRSDAAQATEKAASGNSIYCPWVGPDGAPRRRHREHFFELTAQQWSRYVAYVLEWYGSYWTAATGIGVGGGFSQGAIFRAAGVSPPRQLPASLVRRFTPFVRCGAGQRSRTAAATGPCSAVCQGSEMVAAVSLGDGAAVRSHDDDDQNSKGVDRQRMSSDATLGGQWRRGQILSNFPFDEIFGMSPDAYYTAFHIPSTEQLRISPTTPPIEGGVDSAGEIEDDRLEKRKELATLPTFSTTARHVIPGTSLWLQLCRGVERGYELYQSMQQQQSSRTTSAAHACTRDRWPSPSRGTRFLSLFEDFILPGLYAQRHSTVPLLIRCLEEQQRLWRCEVLQLWAAWRRLLQEERAALLHGLRVEDATVCAMRGKSLMQPRIHHSSGVAVEATMQRLGKDLWSGGAPQDKYGLHRPVHPHSYAEMLLSALPSSEAHLKNRGLALLSQLVMSEAAERVHAEMLNTLRLIKSTASAVTPASNAGLFDAPILIPSPLMAIAVLMVSLDTLPAVYRVFHRRCRQICQLQRRSERLSRRRAAFVTDAAANQLRHCSKGRLSFQHLDCHAAQDSCSTTPSPRRMSDYPLWFAAVANEVL